MQISSIERKSMSGRYEVVIDAFSAPVEETRQRTIKALSNHCLLEPSKALTNADKLPVQFTIIESEETIKLYRDALEVAGAKVRIRKAETKDELIHAEESRTFPGESDRDALNRAMHTLYTYGSLLNTSTGIKFSLKNRLNDAKVFDINQLTIDGVSIPSERIGVNIVDIGVLPANSITKDNPVHFPLSCNIEVHARTGHLGNGIHSIDFRFDVDPYGSVGFSIEDEVHEFSECEKRIPRSLDNDYCSSVIEQRQDFVEKTSGLSFHHVTQYSFDPLLARGNCEHFTGIAQVPLGIAGPILINGEHAVGEFLIPLATTEGTLVASYNRGIKALNLSGGVTCTVVEDAMQRAPVFAFENARAARAFRLWVAEHSLSIAAAAETTSRVAQLKEIDCILSNKFAFLRFNYTTGDAAGQNMVSRATHAACHWIIQNYERHQIKNLFLEANLATDKKPSLMNTLRTRGKRVVAEACIPRAVLLHVLRAQPENIVEHSTLGTIGTMLSGANNNGLHSVNAIAAMFIATGQDVANTAEASAGIFHVELAKNGDLYVSITIPSLIVGTHGGGTSLPTQRECLEMLGCYGTGKARKLAEIIAGVVLAGELSLISAISSLDWITSHEEMGRKR